MSEALLPVRAPSSASDGRTVQERIRSEPMIRFPVGPNAELVYFPALGATQLLAPEAADTLAACDSFATFREHAQRLASLRVRNQNLALIEHSLRQFGEAGALIREGEWIERCRARAGSPVAHAPGISALGWITHDRAAALRASICSFAGGRQLPPDTRLAVYDDGDAAARTRTIEMLTALSHELGRPILYAGLAEKREYGRVLAREADCPQDIVDLALGCAMPGLGLEAMGANRNSMLLDTVGEIALSIDDDVTGLTAAHPAACEGELALSCDDRREMWFFDSHDEALLHRDPEPLDVILRHGHVLGRPLDDLIFLHEHVELGRMCDHLLEALRRGGGYVAASFNGVLGDSALYSTWSLLQQTGATRQRLLSSEAAYRRALTSREMLAAVSRTTVSHGGLCMGYTIGLDNRGLLAPFPPVLRNEDGVFGALMHRCFPGACFAHLPFAVLHAPPQGRGYATDYVEGAAAVRMCDILISQIESAPLPADADGDEAVRAVGQALVDCGNLPLEEFQERARLALYAQSKRRAGSLYEWLAQQHGAPKFWSDDLRCQIAAWEAAILDPSFPAPSDLPARDPALAQDLVFRYGQFLAYWPALVAAAKDLAARGRRLSGHLPGAPSG
jgi:hypothetical protein